VPACLPPLQLYLEDAIVGFVCEVLEFTCGLILIAAKIYLDNYGPLSARGKRRRQNMEAPAAGPPE
jgi:hypothetical protein